MTALLFRLCLLASLGSLVMGAGAAEAEIESIHRTSFRNPEGFCQGDHRAYMPSRFANINTAFDLTGPGTIQLEFFGNGADLFVENIKLTGSSAISITGRYGKSGPDNFSHACGAIGSVKLFLKLAPIAADATAYLEVGGSRIPIRLHARRATGLRWEVASPANYNGMPGYDCLKMQGRQMTGGQSRVVAGTNTTEGKTLRVTLSPDDLAVMNACATPPRNLWVGFTWDREEGVGELLNEVNWLDKLDPIKTTLTRKTSSGSAHLTAQIPPSTSGNSNKVELLMSELNTFIGTASYEVSLSPALNSPPIRLIIDTVPANGVKSLNFSVPTAMSPVRNARVSYTLQAPAQTGQTLSWTTYAKSGNGSSSATRVQNNCFEQANGTVTLQAGSTSGDVVLALSDAPGCSGLMAQVQLRAISATPVPQDFNFTPLSSVSGEFDLPDHMITQLVNPPKSALKTAAPAASVTIQK